MRNFPKLTEEEMPNPEADIEIVPQLEHCKSRHHNVWLGEWTTDCLVILSIFSSRGHSQMTSEERGREGVGQFLTIGREVAWIWY